MATKSEIIQLLTLINKTYPSSKYDASPALVDIWLDVLGHYDFPTLKVATYLAFETCRFAPTIAEIKEALKNLALQSLPSEGDAWKEVIDGFNCKQEIYTFVGVRNLESQEFATWEEAKEFAGASGQWWGKCKRKVAQPSFSPMVARVVELLGGMERIENADNPEVIRGQFGRFYRELRDRLINERLSNPAIREAGRLLAREIESGAGDVKALSGSEEEQ